MTRSAQSRHGPACPACGSRKSKVLRTAERGDNTSRVRKCGDCDRKYTTTEGTLPSIATGIGSLLADMGLSPLHRQHPGTLSLESKNNAS